MKTGLDQNLILAQMQKLNQAAKSGASQAPISADQVGQVSHNQFGNLLNNAINTVNQYQQNAAQAATAIETGDGGVSLVKAMIASQKANVAFQATVQVRNKVVTAYQDIMNMPI